MFDLKIINGLLVNNTPIEIGIKDGKIVKVSSQVGEKAKKVIDAENSYISYGWIDSHVHCYEKMTLYYDFPDKIGVEKGVTTVIDAGSSGEGNIKEFYELTKKNKTNVLALINISKFGIIEQDELADLDKINERNNIERIKELPEFIIGIKARMSRTVVGNNNIIPLDLAKKLQNKVNLPLMVHIGSAPPKLEDILSRLSQGDIVTHCYNGKINGIMSEDKKIKDIVWRAYEEGIIFDVGHGTDSFNFKVAEEAIEEGLLCQTISTDIYHHNRENGPVYDLSTTMEKMLALGFDLENIIDMVTKNPAEIFNLSTKGTLNVGMDADITIFNIVKKEKVLIDSNGNELESKEAIIPKACIVGGNLYDNL